MRARRETAFHLAGHAVAAHLSRFHVLAHGLRLDDLGSGEVIAALSRRKLIEARKPAEPSSRTDPDVAISLALVMCAGLASERIAAAGDPSFAPDPRGSADDFATAKLELEGAGLSADTAPHERGAEVLLSAHWLLVVRVAEGLIASSELQPLEVDELIRGLPN